MSAHLNIVAANGQAVAAETVAERVRRLQTEAKSLAKDHTRALMGMIVEAQMMAEEIAAGGEAYPAGIRDLARRFADEAEQRVQTLEAISERVG
jgi:hypothetical protein